MSATDPSVSQTVLPATPYNPPRVPSRANSRISASSSRKGDHEQAGNRQRGLGPSRGPHVGIDLWYLAPPCVSIESPSIRRKWGECRAFAASRIPVATVVGLVAQGMTETQIVQEYPDLEVNDVRQALAYAAAVVDERQLPLLTST